MSARPEYLLNGTALPMPAQGGVKIMREKIWSQNAGRSTATGEFTGDVITMKYTVTLTYETLTEAEMRLLWSFTSAAEPFFTFTFPDPASWTGSGRTRITCYIPPPEYVIRRWDPLDGVYHYDGVSVEFIQK